MKISNLDVMASILLEISLVVRDIDLNIQDRSKISINVVRIFRHSIIEFVRISRPSRLIDFAIICETNTDLQKSSNF